MIRPTKAQIILNIISIWIIGPYMFRHSVCHLQEANSITLTYWMSKHVGAYNSYTYYIYYNCAFVGRIINNKECTVHVSKFRTNVLVWDGKEKGHFRYLRLDGNMLKYVLKKNDMKVWNGFTWREGERFSSNMCLCIALWYNEHFLSINIPSFVAMFTQLSTWGVQVVRYHNFFLGEWKQIETWKLLEKTWLFFRLGEAKWQHCTTRWMLVTRSSCNSVLILKWRRLHSKSSAWLSDSSTCVAWNHSKFIDSWVRHAVMALWTWKMCVRGCDSLKKAERRVT